MLQAVLRLIHSGPVRSLPQLAAQLHVSEDLMEVMLDDLVERGYLRKAETGCTQPCGGCPSSHSCAAQGTSRLWFLTDAGRQVLLRTQQ